MPWKDEKERKQDRLNAVKDAAAELARGNVKDAVGIVKTAANNKKVDPDKRVLAPLRKAAPAPGPLGRALLRAGG